MIGDRNSITQLVGFTDGAIQALFNSTPPGYCLASRRVSQVTRMTIPVQPGDRVETTRRQVALVRPWARSVTHGQSPEADGPSAG